MLIQSIKRISNDPCPVGKDEDEWVAEIVHSVFTNVVSYLWSYSALALRTTLASMPVVSIEVPDEIHLEDSELIVSVAQATARE